MPKSSKDKRTEKEKYGWLHVIKYTFLAFLIYCSTAFLYGIGIGVLETSSNQYEKISSVYAQSEKDNNSRASVALKLELSWKKFTK